MRITVSYWGIVWILACGGVRLYDLVVSKNGDTTIRHEVMDTQDGDCLLRLDKLLPLPTEQLIDMHMQSSLLEYIHQRLNAPETWQDKTILDRFEFEVN